MRFPHRIVIAVTALAAILLAGLADHASAQNRPRPARRGGPQSTQPEKVEPTAVRMDVFELQCDSGRLARLDTRQLGLIGEQASGVASAEQVLDHLKQLGPARLMARIQTDTNLNESCRLTSGARVPVLQDLVTGKGGKPTPSVSYEKVGYVAGFQGAWRKSGEADVADISLSFEMSTTSTFVINVGAASGDDASRQRFAPLPSKVMKPDKSSHSERHQSPSDDDSDDSSTPTSKNLTFTMMGQVELDQTLTVESGKPIVIIAGHLPGAGDDAEATVTLVRFVATRLDHAMSPADEEAVRAPDATSLDVAIVEITGEKKTLTSLTPESLMASEDGSRSPDEICSAFGRTRLLARSPLLVRWPQISALRLGEQVPAKSADEDRSGVLMKDIGAEVTIAGHWMPEQPDRATLLVVLDDRWIKDLSVAAAATGIAHQTAHDTLHVTADEPVWMLGKLGETDDEQNPARRLAVRLIARKTPAGPIAGAPGNTAQACCASP